MVQIQFFDNFAEKWRMMNNAISEDVSVLEAEKTSGLLYLFN